MLKSLKTMDGISIFILAIFIQSTLTMSQPRVTVDQGQILGKTVTFESDFLGMVKNIDVFMGIPYAEPPIGDLRFREPLPKQPWGDDIYNATYPRYICMQVYPETNMFDTSEDCLFLNIYVPSPKPSNASVMVWIHGGGLATGNGYGGFYGGTAPAAIGDVIIVSINYRLSTFGFITTGDDASPGNYGMLDQVEALRWIKTNIHSFGGNPSSITIYGESAGGVSVSAHLFSPLSEALFERAILQSGSVVADWAFHYDLDAQRDITFQLGRLVGCRSSSNTQELMSCMRQVDANILNEVSYQFGYAPAVCVDNFFILEPPIKSLKTKNFKKCPIIHGFNKDEATIFIQYSFPAYVNSSTPPYVSKERFERELSSTLVEYDMYSNQYIEEGVKQVYVDWSKDDDPEADYFEEWNLIETDYWFSCPAILESRHQVMAGNGDVYLYFFTHSPSVSFYATPFFEPRWLGATHSEDLAFVFGYPFDPTEHLSFHTYPEEEMVLSQQIIKYWSNFAKTGNPNQESASTPPYSDDRAWPAFTIPDLQYKELAVQLSTGRAIKSEECHFWNKYLKQLTTFTADLGHTEHEWRDELNTWKQTDMKEWKDEFDKYKEGNNNQ